MMSSEEMELIVNSGRLPVGWEIKKLCDICEIEKNQGIYNNLPYVGMENIESNTAKFIGSYQPQTVKSSTFRFNHNHILYGRLRPYLNKVLAPNFQGHCSTEIFPIKPSECLNKNFLLYWLLMDSTVNNINKTCTGARMPRANMTAVFEFDFPLPPLPEQKRIVAILDEAFEGIDRAISNTEKNLSNARELFESYLNSIFSQKGEGWEEKKLGDLLDTLTDYHANGSYEILKQNVSLLDNDGYAYMVRSTDFDNNFTNSLKYIDKHAYEFLRKSKVFGGEIIISKIGNAGKVYLMPNIDRPCSLAMNLFLLRTDAQHIQSDYLYFFLESQFGKVQIAERLNGTTTKTIRKDGIRSLNILVSPLSEQKKIVEKLDSIVFETQRLETIYRQKIAALKELKQSILQKAFTGELTTDKCITAMEETAA